MLTYITAFVLLVVPVIAVPWTNATCVDDFWSFNSRGQSPCLVAAYLAAPCTTDNTFGVFALDDGGYYGFRAAAASNCLCNSVMWNLISACALCQKASATSWGQWVASCPNNLINVGKYPIPLPANVAVPAWAYYDFTVAGIFNTVTASQQTGPESSAASGPTGPTIPTIPISTVTVISSPTSIPNPKPIINRSRSNSYVNSGGIIGGVVGSILGIRLIALIIT
ncbi:hypothetical protein OPQ81_003978 [Rhizoctonia solani]|nr:hypothetical protein OPQ81_003978 [Rhizoctonia solani]